MQRGFITCSDSHSQLVVKLTLDMFLHSASGTQAQALSSCGEATCEQFKFDRY